MMDETLRFIQDGYDKMESEYPGINKDAFFYGAMYVIEQLVEKRKL